MSHLEDTTDSDRDDPGDRLTDLTPVKRTYRSKSMARFRKAVSAKARWSRPGSTGSDSADESPTRKPQMSEESPVRRIKVSADAPERKVAVSGESPVRRVKFPCDAPVQKVAVSQETSKRRVTLSGETPKRRVVISDETPKRKVTVSNETPKRKVTVSDETPKRQVTFSDEPPKRQVGLSDETLKRRVTLCHETPMRKPRPSVSFEHPVRKVTASGDTPVRKVTVCGDSPVRKFRLSDDAPVRRPRWSVVTPPVQALTAGAAAGPRLLTRADWPGVRRISAYSPASSPEGDLPSSSSSRKWSTMSTFTMVPNVGKDEYLYRLVLHTVVNPLGAPDTRPGLRPDDLARHLMQVFDVEQCHHDKWTREVQNSRPSNIALNVAVVEASGLKAVSSNGLSDPYCIVCLAHPRNKTPRGSPKSSPNTPRRRRASYEHSEMKKTQTIKASLHPKWNEEFEIDIQDLQAEELQVFIWASDEGSKSPSLRHADRHPSPFRSLFRQIRPSGRPMDEFLGQFKVPLRDIPATGLDKWFPLYEDRKQRVKGSGQCRLRLQLSIKQEVSQLDTAESDQCSIEDFYSVMQQIYRHAITEIVQEAPEGEHAVLNKLPQKSGNILHQFAVQHHFSRLTQILIEMVVMLECAVDAETNVSVSEKLLQETIVNMELEWLTLQTGNHGESTNDRVLLTDIELSLLDRAASDYVEQMICGLDNIPTLFPPVELNLDHLNQQLKFIMNLLNLHVWSQNETARKDLSYILTERLQTDVQRWVQTRLDQLGSPSKDAVVPEVKQMVALLTEAMTAVTPIYSIAQHFLRIGMDYFKVASLSMENKLGQKAQEMMLRMDQYQVKYQKFRVNIRESSTAALQLYLGLRNFFNMIRTNINERDIFRLTVSNYQTWFETSVIFWLQTFKEESTQRMEKALEIDKDVVRVTSLVKYSNSSVDVLTNFSKITAEWCQIDFSDADISVLGVTKITDTICDGARQYVSCLENILENNGYYDMDDNNQFDVTEQLCITLNNIEHVRQYLQQLPSLLNFEVICQAMSVKHEDEAVGGQSLDALRRLVKSADEDIFGKGAALLNQITEKMAVDLRKYTEKFTRCDPDKRSSIDVMLAYLENNLQVLYERLESSIFPTILQQIWLACLHSFNDTLVEGRSPSYYDDMAMHLRSLRAYFHRGGVDDELLDGGLFSVIVQRLQLNSMNSEELILSYFKGLVEDVNTPHEYHGHLALKVGYMEETGGNATIYLEVVAGHSLPAMTRAGTSDAFVTASLFPTTMFQRKGLKSHVINKTVNPVFNTTFQFTGIPVEFLREAGAVLVLTAWHQDNILPCSDFLGEVLLHIVDIPKMSPRQTIEDMPAILLPLKQPAEPTSGPYQVLQDRSSWDVFARQFLTKRRLTAGYTPTLRLCTPVRTIVNTVFRRKGKAAGLPHTQHSPSAL